MLRAGMLKSRRKVCVRFVEIRQLGLDFRGESCELPVAFPADLVRRDFLLFLPVLVEDLEGFHLSVRGVDQVIEIDQSRLRRLKRTGEFLNPRRRLLRSSADC